MAENLLVGVGRSDITPKIGCQLFGYRPDLFSDGVNDNLTATAFAFTYGETTALMVTVCVCLLDNEITGFFSAEIEKRYNIALESDMEIIEIIDNICEARKFVIKGGDYDYDRCCSAIISDFKHGKFGNITLETVKDIPALKKNDRVKN